MSRGLGDVYKRQVSMLLDRVDDPDMPPEKRLFSGVLRDGSSIRG